MDEIEVKLSPLDEDSKAALLSFVAAIKEVRESMDDIKKSFNTQLTDFKNIASAMANMAAATSKTEGQTYQQLTIPGMSKTDSGKASEASSKAVASAVTPRSAVGSGQSAPNVDQGGHGGTAGGGGTGDSTLGYPYPGSPSGDWRPDGAAFYDRELQIPRINKFNLQDYARMAGKVVAGTGPMKRYRENYQAQYQESRDMGNSHEMAHEDAMTYAQGAMSSRDQKRFAFGRGAERVAAAGPYLAATQNLIPQLFGGPFGILGAGALSANMNAQMGISGTPNSFLNSLSAPGQALLAGATGNRALSGGNETLYRFGKTLLDDRLSTPEMIGLFSPQERGQFAEASVEVAMRGGEFDTAFDRYSAARRAARPIGSMAPGQYVELMREQTRYGGASAGDAATNLEKLGDAALTAGLNIKQMGEAAQLMHQTFPQLNMVRATQQTAKIGAMGMNPVMMTELMQNPALNMSAYSMGALPSMLPGMQPTRVLKQFGETYQQQLAVTKQMVKGLPEEEQANAIKSLMYQQYGYSQNAQDALENYKGYGALGDVNELISKGGKPEEIMAALSGVKLPGADGDLSKLDPASYYTIANPERKKGESLTKARQRALNDAMKKQYGFDINNPEDALLQQATREVRKENPGYTDAEVREEAKKRVEKAQGEMEKAGEQLVKIGLTGTAEQMFKIMEDYTDKPDAASPKRKGANARTAYSRGGGPPR